MSSFLRQQVDPNRPDGYWVETFPYSTTQDESKPPHLVGYGLGTSQADSKVLLYLNPYNASVSPYGSSTKTLPWEKREIAELRFPVACTIADVSGNGFNDVILSDEYGPSMNDIWPDGGRVSWFENTGDTDNAHWKRRFIGKSPGMHRLKAGHFTRTDKVQIVAVPIVIQSSDLTSPAPVIIYTAPDDPLASPPDDDSVGWLNETPFPDSFRLVHEVFIFKREGQLDQIVLAGREGISLVWFDTKKGWLTHHLGSGCPEAPPNPYWGSGSVAIAKVKDDHAGYIGSSEGFHGNIVSAYIKPPSSPSNTLNGVDWIRVVLDDFGPLNSENTGSIHQVVCADIDGDGVDEILVALMGSDPPSWERTGVWCYKPIDLEKGTFKKIKLSDDSAGRIAIGDFTDRGLVDYATISYSVPGYFESPGPAVNCYASAPIRAQRLNDEVLFLLPNPTEAKIVDEVEFLDVSSKKLSLVVLPPRTGFNVGTNGGVKVILGELTWTDASGERQSRTQATTPFGTASNIVDSELSMVKAGPDGAAFMLLKPSTTSGTPPYSDMSQLVAHNIFPPRFPADIRDMQFPWVKVEDRPWANGRFKDLEFYNLIGFQVKLANDSLQHVCHIQLWTAGVGVSAGFHNHTGDFFCEIHSCIVNGTGQGGMSWATVADDKFDANNPDPSQYDSIIVPDMHEHGPLWRTQGDGLPAFRRNSSIDYPWHAWLAGPIGPTQAFDVWIAFEFPPLGAAELRPNTIVPPPTTYLLRHATSEIVATVRDGDSTDGTPIIGTPLDLSMQAPPQQWAVNVVTGTKTLTIENVGSGSFATTNWPPVSGQSLAGSRSLALLGITSNWVFTEHDGGSVKIWLVGTNLVWTLNANNQVVLEAERTGDKRQNWSLDVLGPVESAE
ncbi:hypothetical protein BDN72DRAFT_890043 [Pluteus cervinus]|uniref:Uncharacterized protein n=1 Tax=Pluteus cervinus TaxID=181527 RepID=A0ACD3AA30_9AGAR|nr:hypothetical protein BDN72DRAFT_890043 [Pluteus cervinus]